MQEAKSPNEQPAEKVEPKVLQLHEHEYYQDNEYLNFSALKVFSRCETLYRDTFISKTYTEPDKDYFVYGKLVDCMTLTPSDLDKKFVQVARRMADDQMLKLENDIKALENEIAELKKKPQNGTTTRSISSREKKINEIRAQVTASGAGKIQVVPSMWKHAYETAEAIKNHPFYKGLKLNDQTTQQTFATEVNGIKMKGRLDYLDFADPMADQLFLLFCQNMIDEAELKKQFNELKDKRIRIVDVKTCYSLKKLEPFNYRGQLSFYEDLVSAVFGVDRSFISSYILAGDKEDEFKKSELFFYPRQALDEIKPDILEWAKRWQVANRSNHYVSDKAKRGIQQDCFTCSECRVQPLSAGKEMVTVNGPRFEIEKSAWAKETE